MKQIIILSICILTAVLSEVGCANSETKISQNDAYIIMDRLLNLSAEPKDIKEKLKRYKRWEAVYAKFSSKDMFDLEDMKVYLFIVFVAEEKAIIQTQEDISGEIINIFNRQPNVFLDALNEAPFLIDAVSKEICEAFSFKAIDVSVKSFLKNYEKLIFEKLGDSNGGKFLRNFSQRE